MPDLMDFSVTRAGSKSLTVPTWTIQGRLVDSQTQRTLHADFTGANSVSFPQIMGTLTNAQQDSLVEMLVRKLLEFKFGV